jgi:hypothetical protein
MNFHACTSRCQLPRRLLERPLSSCPFGRSFPAHWRPLPACCCSFHTPPWLGRSPCVFMGMQVHTKEMCNFLNHMIDTQLCGQVVGESKLTSISRSLVQTRVFSLFFPTFVCIFYYFECPYTMSLARPWVVGYKNDGAACWKRYILPSKVAAMSPKNLNRWDIIA